MTKLEKDILLDKMVKVIERDLYRGFQNTWSRAQVELYMDLIRIFAIPMFTATRKYNEWRNLPNGG